MQRLVTLAAVLALAVPIAAQQDRPPSSFEHLSVSSTALTLAATTVNPASTAPVQYCRGVVETANLRARVDGTAATATVGHFLEVGALVEIAGQDAIRQFSVIRDSTSDGALPLTCYVDAPAEWRGALQVTPPTPGHSTTGTGAEVHSASPTLTGTIDLADEILSADDLAVTGSVTVEGRWFVRDSFDQGYFVHQDDMTAKSLTDAEVNIVHGSPIGLISYREEIGKTASSWLVADGTLDIGADDTSDDEGVEVVFGGHGTVTSEGVIVAGTSGACVSASITLTDISGTDQLLVGWRQNETFTDAANFAGYTVWNTVGVSAADGSILSEQEVSEATDSDDSGVNMADGETRAFKVCVDSDGVPTAFYSDALSDAEATGVSYNAITMTETGSTLTAGTQLYPFLTFMAAGTDGPNPIVNWVQLEAP